MIGLGEGRFRGHLRDGLAQRGAEQGMVVGQQDAEHQPTWDCQRLSAAQTMPESMPPT